MLIIIIIIIWLPYFDYLLFNSNIQLTLVHLNSCHKVRAKMNFVWGENLANVETTFSFVMLSLLMIDTWLPNFVSLHSVVISRLLKLAHFSFCFPHKHYVPRDCSLKSSTYFEEKWGEEAVGCEMISPRQHFCQVYQNPSQTQSHPSFNDTDSHSVDIFEY